MDDYPGIEIRVTRYTPDGPEIIFEGDSQELHFQLMSMWHEAGFAGDSWYPVRGGYMLGELLLEIRAVELPELAAAPDYPADLFRGQAGALGELAELERAAVGRAHERAAAAGHSPCCCHGGFSGDHDCCIHPAAVDVGQAAELELAEHIGGRGAAAVLAGPGHAAAPVSSAGWEGTGAVDPGAGPDRLTERDQSTGPTRRRLRAGSAIVRIARRALSLSGR